MPQKGRLSVEDKVKIVREYLSGAMGPSEFRHKYGVRKQTLYEWVRLYKIRGAGGLTPSTKNRNYSPETKRQAVLDYLSGGCSQRDICLKYDISNRQMLQKWIRRYNSHGDFIQPNSGGEIYMAKGRKTTLEERVEIVSYCIANNKDYGKAIERYGVSYQQIYGWVRKYEKVGAEGLSDHRGKGKDQASMSEVEKLRAQLKLKEAENRRLQMENDLLKKLEEVERRRGID
jgi:transposase-like protein